jgi:hypothetical protein
MRTGPAGVAGIPGVGCMGCALAGPPNDMGSFRMETERCQDH